MKSHKKAVRACRDQVAFYASAPNYKAVLEQHGYEDLSEELNRLSKQGKWKEMGDAIDDEFSIHLQLYRKIQTSSPKKS